MASPISGSSSSSPSILNRAREFVEEEVGDLEDIKDTVKEKGKETVAKGKEFVEAAKDGFEASKAVMKNGWERGVEEFKGGKFDEIANPEGKLNLLGKLKLGGGAVGTVTGLLTLPSSIHEISEAADKVRNASGDEKHAAIMELAEKSGEAAKGAVATAAVGLETATAANKLVSTYKAAATAFEKVAPDALPAVKKAASFSAMKQVYEGGKEGKALLRAVAEDATGAAKVAGKALGEGKGLAQAVIGTAGRAEAKVVLEGASHAAAEAALHAGAEVAGKSLAKAAARFAPGANIAMAAIDTGVAVATLRDPHASTGKKTTACITAAGSILAATNIPIVSQVGAGISVVSSLVGGFFYSK